MILQRGGLGVCHCDLSRFGKNQINRKKSVKDVCEPDFPFQERQPNDTRYFQRSQLVNTS